MIEVLFSPKLIKEKLLQKVNIAQLLNTIFIYIFNSNFIQVIKSLKLINIIDLKKVTSDMQTHKNPSLRTGPAPFKAPIVGNTVPTKTVPSANAPIDKPPVFTRDGKKWLVVNNIYYFILLEIFLL